MKNTIATVTAFAALSFTLPAFGAELTQKIGKASSCREVSALVTAALTDAGGKDAGVDAVRNTLRESLEAKPSCACEIVTATIVATGSADKSKAETIEAIVETAVKTLPDRTAEIAECAVAAAPNHSALIEKTLKRVFSENEDKLQGDSKSTETKGKEVKDEPKVYEPEAPLPAPVYLIAPGGGYFVPVERPSPSNPRVRPGPYDDDRS